MAPGSIPSPTASVLHLGPIPLRAYALCILAGIIVALWLTGRRLRARGHDSQLAVDVGAYAVVAGIIGGRLWHVITTPQPYFGAGGQPLKALAIWEGGLGIWGAVALGALGAWWGCRRYGVPFLQFADAAAPGVALAQAIGRWGNWFNNELHGRASTLPWAVQIHEWDQSAGRAVTDAAGKPIVLGTFQPTFLYESIFLLVLTALLLLADRRWQLAPGVIFGMYVAGYPVGRVVMEFMRDDFANRILGLRVNVWTSLVTFVLGLWIIWHVRRRAAATGEGTGQVSSAVLDEEPAERPGGTTH